MLVLLMLLACSGSDDRARPTEAEEPAPVDRDEPPAPPPIAPGGPPFVVSEPAVVMREPLGRAAPSPVRIPFEGGAAVVELRAPARFMDTEPALAHLVLSLEGDARTRTRPAFYSQPRDSAGRPPPFVVAFRTADGRVLGERPGPAGTGGSGQRAAWPGQPVEQDLPLWAYGRLAPGRYTLHVETSIHLEDRQVPVAVEAPIEVVPLDPAAVRGVIDAIGGRVIGDHYDHSREAIDQLERVRDPRALDWWLRLAQKPSSESRFLALRQLERSADPRALRALLAALGTRPEEMSAEQYPEPQMRAQAAASVRHAAVQILATRSEPEALRAILALRDDPDEEIRLNVLHRASRLPPREARPFLDHYANDRAEIVRSEARRYLGELSP